MIRNIISIIQAIIIIVIQDTSG